MFTNPFGFVHNSDIFAPYTLTRKQANLFFPLFSFFFFYTKRKRAAASAAARFLRGEKSFRRAEPSSWRSQTDCNASALLCDYKTESVRLTIADYCDSL